MQTALLARQSIYDKQLNVVAYELLYRPGEVETSQVQQELDGDQATSTVILNTFSSIGAEEVIGDHVAFINFTRNLLIKELHEILPHNKVVIEILEDVTVDEALIASVKKLKEQGYTIALDDFIMEEHLKELVELADIIKLDVLDLSADVIKSRVEQLAPFSVKLLAEKIETHETFTICKELGFDYFQGYFLSKPNIIKGQKLSANRLVTLKLMSELQKEDADITEIGHTLSQDAALTYKLLRLINSAAYGSTRKIESLHEAIVRIGTDNIRNWAALIILADTSDKPVDLMYTTMIRGKMCELLAEKVDEDNSNLYFTIGLFSTMDAILDQELSKILDGLPLSETINAALLKHEGEAGKILANVKAYERGEWQGVDYSPLNEQDYSEAYLQSIEWANSACSAILK